MALPLALFGLAASTLVGVAYQYRDDIAIYWKGKKLAVLGARGAGKTSRVLPNPVRKLNYQ